MIQTAGSGLWALVPDLVTPEMAEDLQGLAAVREALGPEIADAFGRRHQVEPVDPVERQGSLAILKVHGVLRRAPGWMRRWGLSDQATTVELTEAVRRIARDDGVETLVLHVRTPGGEVFGVPELAEALWSLRDSKRVVAYVEDLGTSGGQWIASQASEVVCNAVANVGSVGVLAVLVDSSEFEKVWGWRIVPIGTGKAKAVGVRGAPITAAHEAEVLRQLEEIAEVFYAHVGRGRRLDAKALRSLEARTYIGRHGIAQGLADRIVPSFHEYLASLGQPTQGTGAEAPAAPDPDDDDESPSSHGGLSMSGTTPTAEVKAEASPATSPPPANPPPAASNPAPAPTAATPAAPTTEDPAAGLRTQRVGLLRQQAALAVGQDLAPLSTGVPPALLSDGFQAAMAAIKALALDGADSLGLAADLAGSQDWAAIYDGLKAHAAALPTVTGMLGVELASQEEAGTPAATGGGSGPMSADSFDAAVMAAAGLDPKTGKPQKGS